MKQPDLNICKEWLLSLYQKSKPPIKKYWPAIYGVVLLLLVILVIYQQMVISTLQWQVNYQSEYEHKDSNAHRLFHLEVIQRALNSDVYRMKQTVKQLSEDNMYLKLKVNDLEWQLMKSQWGSSRE